MRRGGGAPVPEGSKLPPRTTICVTRPLYERFLETGTAKNTNEMLLEQLVDMHDWLVKTRLIIEFQRWRSQGGGSMVGTSRDESFRIGPGTVATIVPSARRPADPPNQG